MHDFKLKYKFSRKLLKKLTESHVPIEQTNALAPQHVKDRIEKVNRLLRTKQYFPSTAHGFLGINKSNGVTRFIPILSSDDMLVYYYICYLLADVILVKQEGIYGGWHIVPDSQKRTPTQPDTESSSLLDLTLEEVESYLQDYFSDSISKKNWWKDWRRFIDMISELTNNKQIGNYVLTSDIANFYDSISIDILVRKLRRKTTQASEPIDVLEVFLNFWNRRVNGYSRSSKGIPQELFSDASRVLSHFYLQDFDENFKRYCDDNNITYCRWADDILLFGPSRKKLELALHRASKILLADGLHLSAGKTQFHSKKAYRRYRCVELIAAANSQNTITFERALRSFKLPFDVGEIRRDTLLKTTIGFAAQHEHKISSFVRLFIDEAIRNHVDLSLSLNDQQIFNSIRLNPNPVEIFQLYVNRLVNKPYASSRATFLKLLRRRSSELIRLGISRKRQIASIERIQSASEDSTILQDFCIPATRQVYNKDK